jgi:hypothetical protein
MIIYAGRWRQKRSIADDALLIARALRNLPSRFHELRDA